MAQRPRHREDSALESIDDIQARLQARARAGRGGLTEPSSLEDDRPTQITRPVGARPAVVSAEGTAPRVPPIFGGVPSAAEIDADRAERWADETAPLILTDEGAAPRRLLWGLVAFVVLAGLAVVGYTLVVVGSGPTPAVAPGVMAAAPVAPESQAPEAPAAPESLAAEAPAAPESLAAEAPVAPDSTTAEAPAAPESLAAEAPAEAAIEAPAKAAAAPPATPASAPSAADPAALAQDAPGLAHAEEGADDEAVRIGKAELAALQAATADAQARAAAAEQRLALLEQRLGLAPPGAAPTSAPTSAPAPALAAAALPVAAARVAPAPAAAQAAPKPAAKATPSARPAPKAAPKPRPEPKPAVARRPKAEPPIARSARAATRRSEPAPRPEPPAEEGFLVRRPKRNATASPAREAPITRAAPAAPSPAREAPITRSTPATAAPPPSAPAPRPATRPAGGGKKTSDDRALEDLLNGL